MYENVILNKDLVKINTIQIHQDENENIVVHVDSNVFKCNDDTKSILKMIHDNNVNTVQLLQKIEFNNKSIKEISLVLDDDIRIINKFFGFVSFICIFSSSINMLVSKY